MPYDGALRRYLRKWSELCVHAISLADYASRLRDTALIGPSVNATLILEILFYCSLTSLQEIRTDKFAFAYCFVTLVGAELTLLPLPDEKVNRFLNRGRNALSSPSCLGRRFKLHKVYWSGNQVAIFTTWVSRVFRAATGEARDDSPIRRRIMFYILVHDLRKLGKKLYAILTERVAPL